MGHVIAGYLRELCNTTFCIINARCCPLLKGLEGNKNYVMNILFVNLYILRFLFVFKLYFFYNFPKELRNAIREDP
jgi:hypothetical protein